MSDLVRWGGVISVALAVGYMSGVAWLSPAIILGAFVAHRTIKGLGSWDEKNIPDLSSKRFLVTGAASGLGLQTARVLSSRGAHEVLMTMRSQSRAEETLEKLGRPSNVRPVIVDHSNLDSTARAVASLKGIVIDVLIANAGVMIPPELTLSPQGWEIQFATNHLNHYALIVGLINQGSLREGSRVVMVSSLGAYDSDVPIDFDALTTGSGHKRGVYRKWEDYNNSKLCNLLFAEGLRRKRPDITVVAAHPGYTATDLQRTMTGKEFGNAILSQGVDIGALPQLRAAVDGKVRRDAVEWIGPSGFWEFHGKPVYLKLPRYATNDDAVETLWRLSEKLTNIRLE